MTIDTDAIRREAEEGLELANKATPGEWIVLKAIDGLYPIAQVPFAREGYQWYTIEAGYPNRSSSKIDAEFIADARTRVPSQAERLKECADEIDRLNTLATDLLDVIFQASVSLYRSDEYPDLPDAELVEAVQSRLAQRFLSGKHEIRPHTFTVTDPKAPISLTDSP